MAEVIRSNLSVMVAGRNPILKRRPIMLRLSHFKCSPSGNITVLVFSSIPRMLQQDIAKQILRSQSDVEQVGFIEKAISPQAVLRLQMMGGEFCGNAAAALAWVLSQKMNYGNDIALEVSGTEKIIQVQILEDGVEVEIPIKGDFSSVRQVGNYVIVTLEGISHVIIDQKIPQNIERDAEAILDVSGLKELFAAGVIYSEPFKDGILITPVVWVRDTKTLIRETSCASGSACIAVMKATMSKESQIDLRVYQPSGKVIITSAYIAENHFIKARIRVKVEILSEGEIAID